MPPHQILIYDTSGSDVSATVGPLLEGNTLILKCEVRGGKSTTFFFYSHCYQYETGSKLIPNWISTQQSTNRENYFTGTIRRMGTMVLISNIFKKENILKQKMQIVRLRHFIYLFKCFLSSLQFSLAVYFQNECSLSNASIHSWNNLIGNKMRSYEKYYKILPPK